MKRLVVGILAHVDAGKTTLSEALLYNAGVIDKLGRVDKKNAYLDTYSLEKERGITIFSKQAFLRFGSTGITLIDTPGHIDFSCEAERALSVEDYAILVISAPNGVEAHTKTLWKLLESRKIPTFIFVNKTDLCDKTGKEIVSQLRASLCPECADMRSPEDIAGADEELMSEFFDTGAISSASIADAIAKRRLFPVFFGSALHNDGVREFLSEFDALTKEKSYSETLFGAKVYKIGRDKSGNRLSYMKITGKGLSAKQKLLIGAEEEKVEEIRLYSAEKYTQLSEAKPGMLVAVTGLHSSYAGMGLGFEPCDETTLVPVLEYSMKLPEGVSTYEYYMKFLTLTEEEPSLSLRYEEPQSARRREGEIKVRLMGEIQLEVLTVMIEERFGIKVHFSDGEILYKETICSECIGSGHFEPLRHYAEVHLRLEPLPRGTGMMFDTECSQDLLAKNWQRLVITHLEEKAHKGVLTGAPVTDIKITLVAGKAHLKHTEGGDFRQATYRAVRQGLMKAESILLEPTFDFRMELPKECLGRAMNDVSSMYGTADSPAFDGETAILTGNCPVSTIRTYVNDLRAYTRGEGRIVLSPGEYTPCHNAEEVIAEKGYAPMPDERNTPNSVFCKNGAGYVVPWDEADALMHVGSDEGDEDVIYTKNALRPTTSKYRGTAAEDKELEAIYERTYGKIRRKTVTERVENAAVDARAVEDKPRKQKPKGDDYLIIDGYNLIFAWERLKKLSEKDFSLGRDALISMMCSYAHFKRVKVVIVFDAYKNKKGAGSEERYGDVTVAYTKEGETADSYIEKLSHTLAKAHSVRVVTSDMQEQLIVLGVGALRVSTREFAREMNMTEQEINDIISELR